MAQPGSDALFCGFGPVLFPPFPTALTKNLFILPVVRRLLGQEAGPILLIVGGITHLLVKSLNSTLYRKEPNTRPSGFEFACNTVRVAIFFNVGRKGPRSIGCQSVKCINQFLTGLMRTAQGLDEDAGGLYDPFALVGRGQGGKHVPFGLWALFDYEIDIRGADL